MSDEEHDTEQENRREYFRVKIPEKFPLTCQLDYDSKVFSGRVHDLSFGGLKAEFSQDPVAVPVDRTINCILSSEKHPEIKAHIRVCFRSECFETDATSIGAAFQFIPTVASEECLSRLIFALERAQVNPQNSDS